MTNINSSIKINLNIWRRFHKIFQLWFFFFFFEDLKIEKSRQKVNIYGQDTI